MKRVFGLVALSILSLGCSRASSFVHPTYDFSALEKVAVVKVTGAKGNLSAQNEVADLFNMQLLRRGFDVIERSQIDAVLTEQEFQKSDMTDTDATEMGKVLNVDAVVIVNVPQDGEHIAMTAKMVETKTGSLLWTGEGTARVGSFLATAGGALVGAVIGAVIGHQVDQGAGTVIGGAAGAALGGVAGYALSPSEANTFRKLVVKITDGMPTKVPLTND